MFCVLYVIRYDTLRYVQMLGLGNGPTWTQMRTAAEILDAHQLQEGFYFHSLVPPWLNQRLRRQPGWGGGDASKRNKKRRRECSRSPFVLLFVWPHFLNPIRANRKAIVPEKKTQKPKTLRASARRSFPPMLLFKVYF